MYRARLITGFLLGISLIGVAATYYPDGMLRFYGDSTLTNLTTGAVYFNTASNTLWMGSTSSVPVLVGSAAWSNNVTASVTNGLPTTNFVNAAVAPLATTNQVFPRLWLATNAWLQVHSDGTNLLWIVATNGTLNVSNVVTTTVLP